MAKEWLPQYKVNRMYELERHSQARNWIQTTKTEPELIVAQAVAWAETKYGKSWLQPGVGSFNMGAVQATGAYDPATMFAYTDHHPDGTPYSIYFKKYPDPVAGMADMVHELYERRPTVRAAANEGDVFKVCTEMRNTTYYEGFGDTTVEQIYGYYTSLMPTVRLLCQVLGTNMPDGTKPPYRTLRKLTPYMAGEDVRVVQKIVGASPDGIFGPLTERAVEAYQGSKRGLVVDGVVGPKTRSAMGLV